MHRVNSETTWPGSGSEVRCLRTKVKGLSDPESVESWAADLSRQGWKMNQRQQEHST